jgi:tRNA A37 methylthiotransferase MiaB
VRVLRLQPEEGTYAADLDGRCPRLVGERLAELRELQDAITAAARDALIGSTSRCWSTGPACGRSHREGPRDRRRGQPARRPAVGSLVKVRITGAAGPDLDAVPS